MRRHAVPLVPDDDAILAILADRFDRVDDELPRLRRWRADRAGPGQLHVVRGRFGLAAKPARAATRRNVATPVLAAGLVAVLAFAVGRALPAPDGSGFRPSDAAVGAAAPPPAVASSALPRPGSAIASAASRAPERTVPPSPTAPTPVRTAMPYDADGLQSALAAVRWPCVVIVRVALDPLPQALLEKLAVSGRLTDGLLPIDSEPTWVGRDPQRAAAAFKGRLIATDRTGALWVLRGGPDDGAVLQLVAQAAPGTTIWRSANVVWPVGCGVAATDPKALVAGRAPGDWPSGDVVDFELARWAGARRVAKPS